MTGKEKRWKVTTMESLKELFGKTQPEEVIKPGSDPKGITTPPKPQNSPRRDDNA